MLENFLKQQQDGVVISKNFPLISNLDMKENIALIQEVHQKKSRYQAEKEAIAMLEKINLASIASKRKNNCSAIERFYVMIIRAFMTQEKKIFIQMPFSFVDGLGTLKEVIETIKKLQINKEVVFIDLEANLHFYKDCQCNMIK